MSKPLAVLISDIHYSLPTLKLADTSLRMAIHKANELDIPVIIAGDLHDTKANLRGECVNAILKTMRTASYSPIVLIGNHDKINEKSSEHSLEFLADTCIVVDKPVEYQPYGWLIPYQHDTDFLRSYLQKVPKNSTIIMHQGITTANPGEYAHDKSAISTTDLADFRVISGHYHTRQDIKCGRPRKGAVGLASYIGNPYTLNYAEANDPDKGFQILNSDGTLTFVPTSLRKHVVIEMDGTKAIPFTYNDNDLLWVKLTAKKEDLYVYTKQRVADMLNFRGSFRLDLIPYSTSITSDAGSKSNHTKPKLLDSIIDSLTNTSSETKARVKELWRGLCE